MNTIKKCRKCLQEKPLDDFPKNKVNTDNLDRVCKLCNRDRMRARRDAKQRGLPMPEWKMPRIPKPPKPPKKPRKTLPPKEAAEVNIYKQYRRDAKRRGYEFRLPFNVFEEMIYAPCVVCGRRKANAHTYGKGRPCEYEISYNGIDRIDNDAGYVLGNLQTMCGVCNKAKYTLGESEFLDWLEAIRES